LHPAACGHAALSMSIFKALQKDRKRRCCSHVQPARQATVFLLKNAFGIKKCKILKDASLYFVFGYLLKIHDYAIYQQQNLSLG
jgi:hypothetical protein